MHANPEEKILNLSSFRVKLNSRSCGPHYLNPNGVNTEKKRFDSVCKVYCSLYVPFQKQPNIFWLKQSRKFPRQIIPLTDLMS